MMGFLERFCAAAAVATYVPGDAAPYRMGCRLSCAAAQVLHAQDAAISALLPSRRRLLLGASSGRAVEAEQWEFTAGEGPTLQASTGPDAVMATQEVITRTWPGLNAQWQQHTAYRSAYAVPLPGVGALTLYFTDPTGCSLLDLGDAYLVAALLSNTEEVTADRPGDPLEPERDPTPLARRRGVWLAAGMIQELLGLGYTDALALLRGRAFLDDRSVDDIAGDVVTGVLDLRWAHF